MKQKQQYLHTVECRQKILEHRKKLYNLQRFEMKKNIDKQDHLKLDNGDINENLTDQDSTEMVADYKTSKIMKLFGDQFSSSESDDSFGLK